MVWIPEEFAVMDQILKTKDHGSDQWDNGWKVESVSSNRIQEGSLLDSHDSIKAHRKQTGDALPKVK